MDKSGWSHETDEKSTYEEIKETPMPRMKKVSN